MDNILGLLRIRVKRGLNLAVRDVRSSDPYVVVKMGKQKLKTRFISKSVNPEWNEDLTLSISDPNLPIKLLTVIVRGFPVEGVEELIRFNILPLHVIADPHKTVYDHDTFTKDDKMGDAEFDIKALVETRRMDLTGIPSGVIVTRIEASRQNCLAEASCIKWTDRKISQDLCLRLRNVECGEVELSLHWVDLPSTKAL